MTRPVIVLGVVEEVVQHAVRAMVRDRFELLEIPETGEGLVATAIAVGAIAIAISRSEIASIREQLPDDVVAIGLTSGRSDALFYRDGRIASIENPRHDQIVALIRSG